MQLLRQFSSADAVFIFSADEKVFIVASPVNLQNDRVYGPNTAKKRDIAADRRLRTRSMFSKSVIVSVAVSKMGCTGTMFVEPGVKVNGECAGAPCRGTEALLERDAPRFISSDLWPPNSSDLNPADYKIWSVIQQHVVRCTNRRHET
jgi:hypothetical protein